MTAQIKPKIQQLLQGYTALVEIPVAWGEMDALGHVNNIVYLRYFETTRIRLCEVLDFGVPNAANLNQASSTIGPILGSISCKFKFPVTYPDTLVAGSRVLPSAVHEFGFDIQHIVVSTRHERIAAEGVATLITYDYKLLKKASLPASIRARLIG